MRKPRLLASLLCAVLMVGVLTVPAYAGGGDESEDGVGEYIPWEGLEPAEPLPAEPNRSPRMGRLRWWTTPPTRTARNFSPLLRQRRQCSIW